MNGDLIRKGKLLEYISGCEIATRGECSSELKSFAENIFFQVKAGLLVEIGKIPAVDAEPVRHGRWMPTNDDNKKRCSRCDVIHLIAQYPHGQANYCPNCGAKMDEDEK